MNYIKSLHIEGFKKFEKLDIDFNANMNILVGENEAGKTTILEAIKIVLSQQYRTADKSILRDLFNYKSIEYFERNPIIKNLPKIVIELEFELDPELPNSDYFYGEVYGTLKNQEEKFGIRFECKFDEDVGIGIDQTIIEKKIPYEYYILTWTTFANNQYKILRKPLQYIFLDTSNETTSVSFNLYNKNLFSTRYDNSTKIRVKNEFRTNVIDAFEKTKLPDLGQKRKFDIDTKKIILENILCVYDDGVALENHGSGIENYIKTELALERKTGVDLILMEEPENHLSFTTLQKMINKIEGEQSQSQIIISTHSNMIASRLNLNNVIWINDNRVQSLKNVETKVASFFVKAVDNAFLQLLLSKKVFLVEGATEFLLIPYFYKNITGHSIEEDEVSVISCNGISYNHYLEIAKNTEKKIAVLTDNDKKQDKIEYAEEFNTNNRVQHIFLDPSVEDWTWEVCLYNLNKNIFDDMIKLRQGANYKYHNENVGMVLGYMLNNKVDTAYKILLSEKSLGIPQYIRDAVKWLIN